MLYNFQAFGGPFEDFPAIYELGTEEMKKESAIYFTWGEQHLEKLREWEQASEETKQVPIPFNDFELTNPSGEQ